MIAFDLPPELWVPVRPAIVRAASIKEIEWGTFPFPIKPPAKGAVAIGTPVSMGKINGLTLNTTATAPIGSVIVVSTQANTTPATTVTDGTNTYTRYAQISGNALFVSNILTSALNSGTNIVGNQSTANGDQWTAAAYVTGISTATPDQVQSGSTATITTGTLAQANEIAFGNSQLYNSGSDTGVVTSGSGFTQLATDHFIGGDHFAFDFSYKIVAATTAVTYSATATVTNRNYGMLTLKGF